MQLVTAEVCFFGCMEFVHLYDHRVDQKETKYFGHKALEVGQKNVHTKNLLGQFSNTMESTLYFLNPNCLVSIRFYFFPDVHIPSMHFIRVY